MKNIINLIVDKVEDNRRVDQFIADKEPTLSRTRIKNLIINSELKINQKVIKDPSKKIAIGDSIILGWRGGVFVCIGEHWILEIFFINFWGTMDEDTKSVTETEIAAF